MHALARLPELWKGEFWQGLAPIHFRYVRPIVSTSYALDWALWGGKPAGFHATNLALHAAVAWLLFRALRRWSGSVAAPGALVAAVAWAWHPSKVEAVSWIAGRTDLFCALGILVACEGFWRRLAATHRAALAKGVLLEVLGLAVAFGSKESAVVVPAFVLLEAWAFFGGALRRAARVAAPYAALAVVYFAWRAIFLPIVPERAGSLSLIDGRLFTIETIGEFARVAVFPYPPSIERAPIRVDDAFHVLHDPARLALGLAALAVLVTGACAKWPETTWRRAGWLLGIAALVPVSNLVSARNVFLFAERFAYVPLMGFALFALPRAPKRWTLAAWSLVLAASFTLSLAHTRHFLDDKSLWAHELEVHPKDPLALRFACEDAMRRHDDKMALELALRGYDAAAGWPVPRPDRVDFAVRAARSLELLTLDHDRATLDAISDFYRTLVEREGVAKLDRVSPPLRVDAVDPEAKMFFAGDPLRVATTKLWAAIAATRIGRCPLALVHDYLHVEGDLPGRVAAVLVLARCEAWDEALPLARALATADVRHETLVTNLEWARAVLDFSKRAQFAGFDSTPSATTADKALESSRAYTLLLDRRRAYRVLAEWEPALLQDRAAATFYARAAWAAGEDDAARRALAAHLGPSDATPLLASWSRELGRD